MSSKSGKFIGILLVLNMFCLQMQFGQTGSILVHDYESGTALPNAVLCFESMDGKEKFFSVSDDLGQAENPVKSRSIVVVSFVGYVSLLDTINAGENKTFQLESQQSLNEVVVTGQYAAIRADKSIYNVQVINAKMLKEKAALNLADALSSNSNIHIKNNGPLGTGLSIQGMDGAHIKILIDGVPVIGRLNSIIDLSQLSVNNVDHIEIIEGPMSVVYGSNALAGAINIISKESNSKKIETGFDSYYESIGISDFQVSALAGFGKSSIIMNGGRYFFDGYSIDNNSRDLDWNPKQQYRGDFSYIFQSKKIKIKLSANTFDEKLWYKGPLLPPYFETAYDTWFSTLRSNVVSQVAFKTNRNRFINTLLSFSDYQRTSLQQFKDLTLLQTFDIEKDTAVFKNYMLRSSLSSNSPKDRLNYQYGIDLNFEEGQGERIKGKSNEIGDYAAFGSITMKFLETFELQTGLRLIYNTVYKAPLVYSFNLRHSVNMLTSRISYSRGFRSPSLKELYLNFVDANHNVFGNENLKAENSHNINASLQFNKRKRSYLTSIELKTFFNIINNNIYLAPEGSDSTSIRYHYVNLARYSTLGFELNFNWKIFPSFSFQTGIGEIGRYMSATSENLKLNSFTFSEDVVCSMHYKWHKANLDFSLFYKYTGRIPEFSLQDDFSLIEGYIDHYHSMDFTIIKSLWKDQFSISAGAKNIFDYNTVKSSTLGGTHSGNSSSTFVGYGRTYFIKLSYNPKWKNEKRKD